LRGIELNVEIFAITSLLYKKKIKKKREKNSPTEKKEKKS